MREEDGGVQMGGGDGDDLSVSFCFWSGVAEARWAGRRQEMSLVEELLVKESSPLSASSGLSESGGGASSVL